MGLDDLNTTVRRLCQEHLAANDEDANWLRGSKERIEWNRALYRMQDRVARQVVRMVEWREWITVQQDVLTEVRRIACERH